MSRGLEELKRMAYENACCRCQYCIDNKCTNKGECVWKTIEKELKELEECREMMKRFNEACVPTILDNETEKKLKVLEIISQNFKLVGNCLHAKNKYAKDGWVFVKELEDEEEHNAWKEVLL